MPPGRAGTELPTGTVTFLFTDVEGSTRLLQELGPRWEGVVEEHHSLLRAAIEGSGGVTIRTEGDAFFAVFPSATGAVSAAVDAQRALARHRWPAGTAVRVRMGLHTGEGVLGGDDYVGLDVHRAARIAAAGHGGQVLLSSATRELVRDGLPDGVQAIDLGPHRLKDMPDPDRLFQVVIPGLPSAFPRLRSEDVPVVLPAELTSFVGREAEVAAVRGLLGAGRLVTLTGPGGTGKTRLAVRVASEEKAAFPDGVFFVDLAAITDHRLVAPAMGRVLGVSEQGARPAAEVLRDHLAERRSLLVLDNLEQVLEATPLVVDLLASARDIRILATSRIPLRVQAEQEYPVPPLGVPDRSRAVVAEQLSAFGSISLFVQRARAVRPDFALDRENAQAVAEICDRLDGLPLAIELAASRINVLEPGEIVGHLDRTLALLSGGGADRPERHRTLRETVRWSYDLLFEPDRALFRRLAVFAGGWDLEGAEAVAHPGGDPEVDVLDGLGRLVDASLVRRTVAGLRSRFAMLETIRAFALECLKTQDDAEGVRARHAAHFLAMAEDAEPHLTRLWDPRVDRIATEHANLRAALRWSIDRGDAETPMRLGAALWRFWQLEGHLAEGREWMAEALALPDAAPRTATRARALSAAGGLAYYQTDLPAVVGPYEESLDILREIGDPAGIAGGAYNLGFARAMARDFPGALELYGEALRLYEEGGDVLGRGSALVAISRILRLQGRPEQALRSVEDGIRLLRDAGDRYGMLDALHARGRAAFELGDLERARTTWLEALDLDEEAGVLTGIAIALDHLVALAGVAGDHGWAVRLAGASESVKEAAHGRAPPMLLDLPDPREVARGSLTEEEIASAWESGRAMSVEEALAFARSGGWASALSEG
ncbi:MAG: tetratricopeptide repeat protein [Actinobacteria bacterium]|nr:tetratricopeptide repeat protein [Actinomycetota bacterium]